MQAALLAGFSEVAALSLLPAAVAEWLARRSTELERGRLRMRIGHTDVFARPVAS
jgi:hypothetical protein